MPLVAHPARLAGAALIALGIGFNIPYAVLAATFDYPAVLRRPAEEVLSLFAEGGERLILTWEAFMVSAFLLAPVALLHSEAQRRRGAPWAAAAGAMGVAAGLLQAAGLARWPFAVPTLARAASEATSAESARQAAAAFDMLNAYGGVAIGEHLGQLATAFWLFFTAAGLFSKSQSHVSGAIALLAGISIAAGAVEGPLVALQRDPGAISLLPIAGYALLTLWMLFEGARLLVGNARTARPA